MEKNVDLIKIKKHYGGKMMHFCRAQFPTLLEQPNLLFETIQNNFTSNKSLYEDLDVYGRLGEFKDYIYNSAIVQPKEIAPEIADPKQLLAEAGYDLYECQTEEEIQKFKKYYHKHEQLCTFQGNRLNRCHVYFAVKKNVDAIKRSDFTNPERQDEYGTSVISIQFTKDESHTLSIKNRYNHHVNNPDATFSNNLDNINKGLTDSFAKHYGMEQQFVNDFDLTNYVKANDGKYYKYNYEINNIYYCPNNIIIDNFKVKKLSKDKYLLVDYFICDLEKKQFYYYDENIIDSFLDCLPEIEKIEIEKQKDQSKQINLFSKTIKNITINVEKNNKIIGYQNPDLKEIKRAFLRYNRVLKSISLPNLEKIANNFLYKNQALKSISLPNLKVIGSNFLYENKNLEKFYLPMVQKIGNYFLNHNHDVTVVALPNVGEIGKCFLYGNYHTTTVAMPKLEKVKSYFMNFNNKLEKLSLPNAIEIENSFLTHNQKLNSFFAPKLEQVGNSFLTSNKDLTSLFLPDLKKIGMSFLSSNEKLASFIAPNLESIDQDFLTRNQELINLHLPNLKIIGGCFLSQNENLESFEAPNLQAMPFYFLAENKKLKHLDCQQVEEIADHCLSRNTDLATLSIPKVKKIGDRFLAQNNTLTEVSLPNLEQVDECFFHQNASLTDLYVPNLEKMDDSCLSNNPNFRQKTIIKKR